MISVEEACRIATEYFKMPYVYSITETNDLFVLPLIGEDGYMGCGGTETVNKTTGEVGIFKRSRDSLENIFYNGKSVEIPEKYRYKGEIKYD